MKIRNNNPRTSPANPLRRLGFTLVELLLVLTILAILAAVVVPNIIDRGEQARRTAAKVQIANFVSALSIFEVDNGYFPKGADGLQALMIRPREAQNTWKGPYLQLNRVPLDPWRQPYVYVIPGRHNPTSYDLYTNGKDAQGGTNTIGNWAD